MFEVKCSTHQICWHMCQYVNPTCKCFPEAVYCMFQYFKDRKTVHEDESPSLRLELKEKYLKVTLTGFFQE